jgi:hypothetical protein
MKTDRQKVMADDPLNVKGDEEAAQVRVSRMSTSDGTKSVVLCVQGPGVRVDVVVEDVPTLLYDLAVAKAWVDRPWGDE